MSSVVKEIFYDWIGGNVWLFKLINGFSGHNAIYDHLMIIISRLSETKMMIIPYFIVLSLVAVFNVALSTTSKRKMFKYTFARWLAVLSLFVVAMTVNIGVNHALKDHFGFPRPYVALDASELVKLEDRSAEDGRRSFPSGHVAFMACFIFSIWEVLSLRMRSVGLLAVGAVAWSRIALGMHFPADVFWSAVITVMVVCLARIIVYIVLSKILRLQW
jgi:membrane-associated phospholipid phosphatase